jgi:hypothetical protein
MVSGIVGYVIEDLGDKVYCISDKDDVIGVLDYAHFEKDKDATVEK